MPPPPLPENEEARLVALQRYKILDTDPEPAFDDLARLTARICQSPIALVTFIDGGRQWFKARFGFKGAETHRDYSFCAHTILQTDVLVVRDAQADERFADNPLVLTPPNLRFYAGAALITPDGYAIGALCVYDVAPRDLTPHQLDALRVLARQTVALLELRAKTAALHDSAAAQERLLAEARHTEETLQASRKFAERLAASSRNILCIFDASQQRLTYINRDPATLIASAADIQAMPLDSLTELIHPDDLSRTITGYRALDTAADGAVTETEFRMRAADGGWRWLSSHNTIFARNPDGSPAQYLAVLEDIHDRRQAENALRQSEARARALLDAVPDVVFRLSPEGVFVDYKGPAERFFVPPSDFLGRHYNDILPQIGPQTAAAIERARQSGKVEAFDYALELPGNGLENFEARLSVDAEGYVLAVVRNITERKRSENALHESEEKFRQLAENLQQVFWIADPELTQILYVSPGYEDVWGRSCESLYAAPRSFLEAAHPDDRERVLAAQPPKLEGDYDVEYRIVRLDGAVRWIWSRAFPIRNHGGEVYRIAGIAEDITARKEIERELQFQKAMLEAQTEAAIDGVLIVSPERKWVSYNRRFLELWGFDPNADLPGSSESVLNTVRDQLAAPDLFLERIDYFYQHGDERGWDQVALKDGRFFERYTAPVNGSDGTNFGRAWFYRDVTQRKQAEQDLQTQKQLFENLVAVARATAAYPTLESTLKNTLDVAVQITSATRGSLFLLDAGGEVMHSILSGVPKDSLTPLYLAELVMNNGLAGWVSRHHQPALVPDVSTDSRWLGPPDYEYPARSVLAVPIAHGDSLLGIVTLLHVEAEHFTGEHLGLMQAAADQMALALRNAQMFEQARRQAVEMYMLNHMTRAALETTDLREMCQTLAERMAELLGADGSFITLWDESEQRVIPMTATGGLREAYHLLKVEPGEPTMTASVLAAGHALVAEDVFNTPYLSRRIAEQFPSRALLGLPLIARNQKLGAVLIGFNQPHKFTPEDVALGEQAARQIALAVSNTILYRAVAEQRGRLQSLIESSRDGVMLVGLEGRILICNGPMVRLLNLPGAPEEWVGLPLRFALRALGRTAPQVVRATLSEMRRIKHGDEPSNEGEYEVAGRYLHWTSLSVMAHGQPLGRLIVLHDVTEERALERVRADLTHMLVHDLRSPLTAIMGAAESLSDRPADAVELDDEMLTIIREGAERMLGLVDGILDVSQLESKQMPIEHHVLALPALISESLQLQIGLIEKQQIELQNQIGPDLPGVWADAHLVERVLQNLVGNAIKFTPPGGVITLTAAVTAADPDMLTLSIRNTGAGVPPEIQNRLFQKFVRGDHKEHGSGLGLAFCRLAVEAHGGRIWAESEPGQSATFHFTLPLHKPGN